MVLSPAHISDSPLESVLSRLKGVCKSLHGWIACCPAHSDREPSLSIGLGDEGHILLKCFAGCSLESIMVAIGMTVGELFPNASTVSDSQSEQVQRKKLDLVDLALEKQLPWKYLFHMGVTEKRAGCLQIPYHLPDGTLAPRHRLRTALVAKEGSHWSKGQGEIVPYGLEGGLTYLEEYLQAHPQVRLVVIDTWARMLPKSTNRQRSQYEDDYEALTPLKYLPIPIAFPSWRSTTYARCGGMMFWMKSPARLA